MTHAELQELIVTRCRDLGHWYYAPQESFRSQPGWVDLVIISRTGGHLFVELKSDAGRRTRPQMQVAELLQRAGLEYRLWRPEDWLSARIETELVTL